MNITVIYGTNHKGSTYHITNLFLNHLNIKDNTISEFYLPKDMDQFCVGCANCFMKGEEHCPHYSQLEPITKAIESADLLIFNSPVYVLHASGQMKTLLDHYGYRFMIHRPLGAMFTKTALILSTAAGGGMKSTNKDIKDSLTFWGVGKIYTYGSAVAAINWNGVSEKNKSKITKTMTKLASRIEKGYQSVKPGIKVKGLFYVMRFIQKHFIDNELDREYWQAMGWFDKNRPWKNANKNCCKD